MKNILLLQIFFFSTTLTLSAQDILKYQEKDLQLIEINSTHQGFLTNNDWHCYKIFIEKREEEIFSRANINLTFSTDQKLKQNYRSGNWKIERDSFLYMDLVFFDERKESHLLRGYYGVKELNDSILTLTRILNSTVDYRYTYYFENTASSNKRINKNLSQNKHKVKRFKEFNQQYKQGLTILEERPNFKKVVIVSKKNCAFYEKKTLADGRTIYTKGGYQITKFDYEYDTLAARHVNSVELEKANSKSERFMRGERN